MHGSTSLLQLPNTLWIMADTQFTLQVDQANHTVQYLQMQRLSASEVMMASICDLTLSVLMMLTGIGQAVHTVTKQALPGHLSTPI